MVSLLIGSLMIGFVLTVITMPFWIKKVKQAGLIWEDMNKYKNPKNVAGSGGIVVVVAFVLGVFYYIAFRNFMMGQIDRINIQTIYKTPLIGKVKS